MNYVTKSGKTSEEFIKGLGRDSILNLSFDFSKNETDVNNHRNYEISTTGYDKIESIARSDAKILFVPGLRSASEKVQVTTSLTRDFAATSQALVEFAENFPAAVTDLSVNDILVPYPRRTINGNWYVDMKFVRYNSWYPVESHFMHNAKMNLNCNAGIVSGTLTLNYRPPMQETVNLAGTCKDNDEAVVTMLLKHLEDMPAEPITFYIDRVEGSSMLYRSFFTSRPEVAPYEIPKDDLSMFLGLFNANGDCVGGFSAKSTP